MAAPDYHAWTHRPKAQGGTDPIAFAGPPSAIADSGGLSSRTVPGQLNPFTMTSMYCTDGNASAYYDVNGTATSFQYIMLLQDGFYQADFSVYWSGTPYNSTDFPFIRPSCVIDGSADTLVNSLNLPYWDSTQGWIGGEVVNSTTELAHHQLVATVWFNYEAAVINPSFGIGVSLDSNKGSGTATAGAAVAVVRLGDALVEFTAGT